MLFEIFNCNPFSQKIQKICPFFLFQEGSPVPKTTPVSFGLIVQRPGKGRKWNFTRCCKSGKGVACIKAPTQRPIVNQSFLTNWSKKCCTTFVENRKFRPSPLSCFLRFQKLLSKRGCKTPGHHCHRRRLNDTSFKTLYIVGLWSDFNCLWKIRTAVSFYLKRINIICWN